MCKCNPADPRPYCGSKEKGCLALKKAVQKPNPKAVAASIMVEETPAGIRVSASTPQVVEVGMDRQKKARKKEVQASEEQAMQQENEIQARFLDGTPLKNPRRERFCQLWASDKEFFGNGVQSYIEAYGIDLAKPNAYNSARNSAYELLTKPDIQARINEIIDATGLSEPYVDKQLYITVTQNVDMKAKVAAISEYNKLKGRITEKVQHTHRMTATSVRAEIERRKNARNTTTIVPSEA